MILPLPRTGPSRRWRLAVDDPDQVVELLAPGKADRTHRLRLVHLAVAEERPDLAADGVGDRAVIEVLHESGLVDRGDGADTKRHRRELPEVRHQPGVGVGREPVATHLLTEVVELLLGEAALEERACVVARRRVSLEVDEVATVLSRRCVPEVIEADLVERGQRLVRGDVAAELRRVLVGAHDHRHGVPAHHGAQSALDLRVAGDGLVERRRDRVDIRRVQRADRAATGVLRTLDDPADKMPGAGHAVVLDDGIEGIEPLGRLDGVDVYVTIAGVSVEDLSHLTLGQSLGSRSCAVALAGI